MQAVKHSTFVDRAVDKARPDAWPGRGPGPKSRDRHPGGDECLPPGAAAEQLAEDLGLLGEQRPSLLDRCADLLTGAVPGGVVGEGRLQGVGMPM